MSDLRQPAGPDLHAIFGIDGAPEKVADPMISAHSGSADVGLEGGSENGFESYGEQIGMLLVNHTLTGLVIG